MAVGSDAANPSGSIIGIVIVFIVKVDGKQALLRWAPGKEGRTAIGDNTDVIRTCWCFEID
jgi:hypothetical protein